MVQEIQPKVSWLQGRSILMEGPGGGELLTSWSQEAESREKAGEEVRDNLSAT